MKTMFASLRIFLVVFSIVLMFSCKEKKIEKKPDSETKELFSIAYKCPMDCEDGKTYHKKRSCPVCKMDLVAEGHTMFCSCTDEGECHCGEEDCLCASCKEHSKKTTCTVHQDGKCECEGEKCSCKNCPVHS